MATTIEVPPLGESVTQAILVAWHKKDGEAVNQDEPVCELETDKANVDIPAKASGVLRHVKEAGETVSVGEVIARIDEGAAAPKAAQPATAVPAAAQAGATAQGAGEEKPLDDLSPAVRRMVEEHGLDAAEIPASGPGGRITKEDVEEYLASRGGNGHPSGPQVAQTVQPQSVRPPSGPASVTRPAPIPQGEMRNIDFGPDGVRRVPMSKIRRRIAENLLRAQQSAAILTTFNEIDLTEVIALRAKHKEQFEKTHGVGLGFMSFFAKATAAALKELPRLNAFIEGDDIVYHNYVHLGIAVSTDRGLAVPVLRNLQNMSFARIEAEIKRLATAVRDGKLGLDELSGGTFSITNGGVFGSLLSTPIINPPQSGILGMHSIQKRAVVVGDKIEVRSMMYVALSYDHRVVDGKEAITFLVRLKQLLEDPARLMLEI